MMSDSAMNFAAEGVLRDTARTEILFIDSGVQGYQALVEGARPGLEIVVLSAGLDGVAQIAAVLSGRSGVDAVHVISHGTPGTLLLGAGSIGLEDLDAHSTELATIRQALSEGADMLLYGCDVAAGDAGRAFVARLAELTGADVAASEDLTGAAFKGGDWRLEVATGTIEAGAALNAEIQQTYGYTLAPADQNFDAEPERLLNAGGETIAGVTYTLVSPGVGAKLGLTKTSNTSIAPDAPDVPDESDLAVMFNYDGSIVIPGDLDARIAAADGAEFRLVSMEIDAGSGLGTSSQLTITGYRDGAAVVGASDTIDTSVADASGSVTYAKNSPLEARGGVLTFDSKWQFIDEIRITGFDAIVAVDELNFEAAVAPNAAPSATNLTHTVAYTEDAGASVPLNDIVVTDADVGETITATLTLSNPAAGGLSVGTFGSATSTFNAGTGVWTVSGSAADVNLALAATAFTPAANWDQNVTIATRIRDAAGDGPADGVITLDVTAVNDAPAATNLTQSKAAIEGGAAVALDDIVVSDVDTGETITGTLTLSNPAAGSLSVGTFGSATSTFNAGTGVWTVTGSKADVNAALASVTLTPSPDSDQNFTITTNIRDAAGTGPADGVISVTVTSANDAPSATNLTHTVAYAEDPGASVPLNAIVVTDADAGDTVTATLTLSNPAAGGLSVGTFGSATSAFNAGTGVWTVSGSVADVNSALAATAFTPAANWDQDVTIATRIRDAAGVGPADGVITLDVTAVNDAPTNDPALGFVNAGVATETGGLATIGAALLHDGDLDDAGDGVTYTISTATTGGTLFLDANSNGVVDGGEALSASSTFTQGDLDAGRVKYLHSGGAGSSDSFGFSVADGGEDGAAALTGQTFAIAIAERPVVAIGGGAPAYVEDGTAVAVAPSLTITDGDSANLAGATVSITDFVAGDSLTFVNQNGITGSFNSGTGVLTLSGTATSAEYQAALRSITYSSGSDNPASAVGAGDRTVSFTVDDGGLTSTLQNVIVSVANSNDAPSATNLTQTIGYLEDSGPVALGDIVVSDVDAAETITATLSLSSPAAGALSTGTFGAATSTYNSGVWTVTGTVAEVNAALASTTFTPAANWNEDVTVTTHIRDAAGEGPADGTITLDATAVNDAPTGSVTIAGGATQGQVLTASNTLADVDGLGPITYQWKAGGVAIAGADEATFTLTQAQVGETITVTANYTDGDGYAETSTSTATGVVANVNDAPTGTVNISGTAYVGQTLTAANTLADLDGFDPASVVYQWRAGGVDIPGANHATLSLAADHLGKAITVIASYTDNGGHNESFASAATEAVINQPAPDPEPQPPTQTETVDGVQVGTSTITNPDGSTSVVITIPVVTPGRTETVGGNTVADIPLVQDASGGTLLQAQIPTGFGLEVSGASAPKSAGNSLADLIREIRAHTQDGSTDQAGLTGGGTGFLQGLSSDTPLLVQTIVPTAAPNSSAPTGPLIISGPATTEGGPMTALVIDTRGLPAGSEIQLQNVEFAAVIGAIRVTGGDGSQHVWGDGQNQHIVLGAGDDELHGGAGDDTIGSKTGQDKLYGDQGRDTVFGGEENDQVFGGADADNVHGNQGDDFVHGNQGDDTVMGGQGDDLVFGGQDNDLGFGDIGNDRLYGDLGADTLQGNQGQDSLSGGEGHDLLMGGRDSDVIRGDAGDDFIWGDLGSDTLSGGSGADRFGFRQGEGADVITDFTFAQGDRIVLDGQGAGWTVSSNASGDAVLNLAGGGSVVLIGVSSADVTQAWFV